MFKPSDKGENITPSKDITVDDIFNSTLLKGARMDIIRIGKLEHNPEVVIYANTLHKYPSELPKGFHEGSDEVMLALYKLNELIFKARVVYPFKVYNYESEQYEYKRNSFMKFIPSEQNKNYKYSMKQDSIDQQSTIFQKIFMNTIKC